MSYREPTKADIGKIIEVTDFEPDTKERWWLKQRLIGIEDRDEFKFIASPLSDSVESSIQAGDYDGWQYARIEEQS